MARHIIIVGGTRGIGAAVAARLVAGGERCTLVARTAPAAPISGTEFIAGDALDEEAAWAAGLEGPLDGLVYAPGSINLRPFRSLKPEDFRRDYEINVIGAARAIRACLKALEAGRDPAILLFSTVAARVGLPFHASISAAKGAIEGLTRSLAAELAPAIRVNAIAPSLTETGLAAKLLANERQREAAAGRHPLGRYGRPEDIAAAAALLLSPESGWITGQVLGVDGGLSRLKI